MTTASNDTLRAHLTMTCAPDCGWCAKRARIEAETCDAAPADDPGHCSHWDEYEPCCRCGDTGGTSIPDHSIAATTTKDIDDE